MNFITRQTQQIIDKTLDNHICLAVTGLSRSGKTAFITSLVHQLIYATQSQQLPLLSVYADGRLLGVKKAAQSKLTVPPFAFDEAMSNLYADDPKWPVSTRGVSEINLVLKYQVKTGMTRFIKQTGTLKLQIIDYPGEWLLDLPMLSQTYQSWSETFFTHHQTTLHQVNYKPWLDKLSKVNLLDPMSDEEVALLAKEYTDLLYEAKKQGGYFIQPGRFVLPGEYQDAPVLAFFPWPIHQNAINESDWLSPPKESLLHKLQTRYKEYCHSIIKPFYENYFSKFDRQVVLIDCLQALNQGQKAFNSLEFSLTQILDSFHYGKRHILRRLFSPCIDKLLFAATKADHITSCQQPNLLKLLNSLVKDAKSNIGFSGIDIDSKVIASIRATIQGKLTKGSHITPVIKGYDTESNQSVTLFPGDVPPYCPNGEFWQSQQFNFVQFAPPKLEKHDYLPHIRLDSAIEYLLGDKLK
ncbi:YcjX family protein [Thorsellia anophelis]|uniref:YcjX family protein n=1 Tax=Thorsellia anophelis DSM 18579 TaxID=1123402 RepID=A0A1I0AQG4_9GAMM|nr:YcjX family protein [Thorsellia anophelis]SES96418.1 hypothetical protein SAMN02583745_01014 [Thorsellia anophelis DSM 18579]